MATRISSGQVEEILARLNAIDEAGRVAFRARIKHFQRLGFPPGSNTGKGRPASHSAVTLLQLIFAFDLTQAGLPPAMVVRIIKHYWSLWLLPACLRAIAPEQDIPEPYAGAFVGGGSRFFVISPVALQPLSSGAEPSSWDDLAQIIPETRLLSRIADPENFSEHPGGHDFLDGPWRSLVVHIDLLMAVTRSVVERVVDGFDWPSAAHEMAAAYRGHELFNQRRRQNANGDADVDPQA
jgi:hypothetical protein